MCIGCFSNYLLKRVFFHYIVVLVLLLKIILTLYTGLRNKPWAFLFSLVWMSVSMLVPLFFIYYSFAISSEIRKCVISAHHGDRSFQWSFCYSVDLHIMLSLYGIIATYYWWSDSFMIILCLSLSLVTVIYLKSFLLYNYGHPDLFWLSFAWSIFFHLIFPSFHFYAMLVRYKDSNL